MKNIIIKFLLQRRFLWTKTQINRHFVKYEHLFFGATWYTNSDKGLDLVINQLTKDL
jgi:hypothetical protein